MRSPAGAELSEHTAWTDDGHPPLCSVGSAAGFTSCPVLGIAPKGPRRRPPRGPTCAEHRQAATASNQAILVIYFPKAPSN